MIKCIFKKVTLNLNMLQALSEVRSQDKVSCLHGQVSRYNDAHIFHEINPVKLVPGNRPRNYLTVVKTKCTKAPVNCCICSLGNPVIRQSSLKAAAES